MSHVPGVMDRIDRNRLGTFILRSAGAISASAILLFALIIAVTGALRTREEIASSFGQQATIQQAQLDLENMLKLQLDEENYIRAYVITRDPGYLDSYRTVVHDFDEAQSRVRNTLRDQHLGEALSAFYDYEGAHADWHRDIATPLLRHPNAAPGDIDKRGKYLIDLETGAARSIETALAARNEQVRQTTSDQISSTLRDRVLWLIAFGIAAMLFNGYRSRLLQELEEEKTTTQTLQRAFISEHAPIPNAEVGSAYGSASSHLAVGGDLFDVYQLSDRLTLVLIADVSGKGVDAAVLTAFIKFTIRGIALRRRDAAQILQEFNTAFPRTVNDPYLFVSMCLGILDTETLRFEYASAGHESAFVRRSNGVEQLPITGPVLGVMEEPYEVRTVYLDDDDTIVLATDGLTEARDRNGVLLNMDGAMKLIQQGDQHPQDLAEYLIRRIRERGGNRLRDDVAILAIRVHEPKDGERSA
ncbi:MAG: SpoIIE family protein phosphatase [Candidatus Eremiobacteraeota bacterium]|nr:SpoIIE family protein phosphatase [Candidatus Eremiobacteraeota bacterium]